MNYDSTLGLLDVGDERMVKKPDVKAYGTSDSVKKAWDTRGRGRHKKETTPAVTTPKVDGPKAADLMEKAVGEDLWNKYPVFKQAAEKYVGKLDAKFLSEHMPRFAIVDQITEDGAPIPDAAGVFMPHGTDGWGDDKSPLIQYVDAVANMKGELLGTSIHPTDKMSIETVLHEIGHSWDYRFGGERADGVAPEIREDRDAARAEGYNELERVSNLAREQGKCDDNGCDLNGLVLKSPSPYSLSSPGEWIADNTAEYFYSPETQAKMQSNSPKTFAYLDKLYKGGYFKDEHEKVMVT